MYLTIVTAESAKITDYGIFGTFGDLLRLSKMLVQHINSTEIGETFEIDSDYSTANQAVLRFTVKDDEFDPSEPDKMGWSKK